MVCLHGSKTMVFSDQFPVTNGVKQGCVLAPALFSMLFSAMLTAAFQDGDNGIPIRYRFDGKLFNLRRLQAKSKVQTEVLDESLFADDMAKGAPTEAKMQKGVDQLSDPCDNYDLPISIKKTEVVYQPAPGEPYKEPTIIVKCQRLQVVDRFTYLGESCTLMMKSMPGLPKLLQHLVDYMVVFRIEVKSGLTSLQSCGAANNIVCMRNVDSLPTACQKTEPLPYKLP